MHKLESFLGNKTESSLGFSDSKGSSNPSQKTRACGNQQEEKDSSTIPANQRVTMKKGKKTWEKFGPCQNTEKVMEYENDYENTHS